MTNDQITEHLTRAELAESVTLPIADWRAALLLAREALAARELITKYGHANNKYSKAPLTKAQLAYETARAACGEEE